MRSKSPHLRSSERKTYAWRTVARKTGISDYRMGYRTRISNHEGPSISVSGKTGLQIDLGGREVVFTESYTKSIENDAFCVPENVGQTTTYKLENY